MILLIILLLINVYHHSFSLLHIIYLIYSNIPNIHPIHIIYYIILSLFSISNILSILSYTILLNLYIIISISSHFPLFYSPILSNSSLSYLSLSYSNPKIYSYVLSTTLFSQDDSIIHIIHLILILSSLLYLNILFIYLCTNYYQSLILFYFLF